MFWFWHTERDGVHPNPGSNVGLLWDPRACRRLVGLHSGEGYARAATRPTLF